MGEIENSHIAATFYRLPREFGMVMHFGPFDPFHPSNFHILKIQDCASCHLEKCKKNHHISATA